MLAALIHRIIPDAMIEKHVAAPARAARPSSSEGSSYAPRGRDAVSADQPARTNATGVVPMFIGIGSEDDIAAGTLMALLCHQRGLAGDDIGKIRMFPRHSLVSIAASVADRVLNHPLHHRGRPVPVRVDRMGESGQQTSGGDSRPPKKYAR